MSPQDANTKKNGSTPVEKENGSTTETHHPPPTTPLRSVVLLFILCFITLSTIPTPLQPVGKPDLWHVWYYGWFTAISTGFGVIPLIFVPELDSYWVGISNAVAAGMMVAASYSLVVEGCAFDEPDDSSTLSSSVRCYIGVAAGLLFILGTKKLLNQHDDLHVGSLHGAEFRRALLIFLVMLLHSFAEGVGIGVSFGGSRGHELGVFISASLAVHNIPEGLAIAVTLLPQQVCKLNAALWAILSSMPQPVMAVLAYMFVHQFIPILPVGLGFAGGAMAWVGLFELLQEAYEDTDLMTTGLVSMASMAFMTYLQVSLDER